LANVLTNNTKRHRKLHDSIQLSKPIQLNTKKHKLTLIWSYSYDLQRENGVALSRTRADINTILGDSFSLSAQVPWRGKSHWYYVVCGKTSTNTQRKGQELQRWKKCLQYVTVTWCAQFAAFG